MKVWITQYALTQGIYTADNAEVCTDISDRMISIRRGDFGAHDTYHKPHWHETRAEAIAAAESMRKRKIDSLRKSIKKMEALTFDNTPE